MRHFYPISKNLLACLFFLVAMLAGDFAMAQVRVPFTQRTSQYTPTRKIYNIKGDFAMIGNTNMTLVNYGNNTSNDNPMQYVDIDGDPNTLNSSSATLVLSNENGAVPNCSDIVFAGLYWTGRAHDSNSSDTFSVTKNGVTKNYNKRVVSLKGPGASGYTTFTAGTNDIWYPNNADGNMYSAYVEVTDYVRNQGLGAYTVADLALREGSGGSTGYYGGWSLVVVYENQLMKYRDITIFDGHAYVAGNITADYEIPVSGFNTVQAGPVNMKLGLMAGEGDRNISGDYFQIRNAANNAWVTLNHANNATNNFFNSSIFTGANSRNPNLVNNTGLDISVFDIPNANNSVMTNNQTSTRFRYGTTQDTFVIFAAVMAVDAYIPDVEGTISSVSINGVPTTNPPQSALPGQILEYKVEIRNRGTEPINNTKITIPVPYNAVYVPNSAVRNIYYTPAPTPNSLVFDPSLGSTGSIVWNIGTVPVPADPETLLGDLVFRFKVTEDCALLKNVSCSNIVAVNGNFTGVGAITGISFNEKDLIQGYEESGECQGNAIAAPFLINIDSIDYVNQNCQATPPIGDIVVCTTATTIPITAITGNFPPGTQFYNQFPIVPGTTVQYTINNPFPATPGTRTYYAVPPNSAPSCNFTFTITVTSITTQPSVQNISYCQGAVAVPLTATPSSPGLNLYWYTSQNGSSVSEIIPSTATPGSTTYYVAEGQSALCIGTKVPVIVTVYPAPVWQAPAAANVSGCSTAAITGLPYAETETQINLTQFTNVGGSVSNAGAIGTYTLTYQDASSGTCPVQVTRTFRLTTVCGTLSLTQNINIQDSVSPVIAALPAASTIACGTGNPVFAQATATDNCGNATLTFEDVTTPGACAGTYSVTRTWTAVDSCGNTSTASQTITVADSAIPTITVQAQNLALQCGSANQDALNNWLANNGGAVAQDSCSAVTWTNDYAPVAGNCSESVVVTFTATDECGNTASTTATFTLQDNTAPVAPAAPANVTVACASEVPANITLTANDVCSGEISVAGVDVVTPGSCANSFTIVRTWTFADACGNSSSASQTITVNDNVAPVAPVAPAAVQVSCASDVPGPITLTANDNCDGPIVSTPADVITPGACENSFVVTRTWTFVDSCGNQSAISQTITVNDNIAPTVPAAPADVTVACASEVPAMVSLTATDNCSAINRGIEITVEGVDVVTPGSCANSYTIVRTWTFVDVCGNESSVSQNISVNDNIAPVAPQAPAAVTVACASEVPAMVSLTATDNCSAAITVEGVDVVTPGSCANSYTIVRTWTFVDECGNESSVSQNISVIDNIAPVAPQAPAAVTVACASEVPAMVSLTATDNCSAAITVEGVDVVTPGSCANSYTIVRSWTFVDECGNESSVSQNISVIDNIAPVAPEAPAAVTVACASEVPAMVSLTATDNCSAAITVEGVDVTTAGSCANSYTIVRSWTFVDECGIESSVSQNISVNDNIAPVAPQAPADITVACASEVPAMVSLTATDNCSAAITVEGVDVVTPGSCANSFTIVRTWTFVDACGNESSVSQNISVNDNISPVAPQAPAAVTVACASEVPAMVSLTATDNCSAAITVEGVDVVTPGSCANSYTIVRTWTFVDECGNESSVSQNISVIDNIAPVIAELPAVSTLECPAQPAFAQASATDNCAGEVTLTFEDVTTAGTCEGSYAITRTWTAVDACGNQATASQTINVTDTTAPVISAEAQNLTVQCGEGNQNALADWLASNGGASATDLCSNITWTNDFDALSNDCSAAVTVTFTATDACGNSASTSATFTVQDTTAPVAPEAPAAVTVACASEVPAMVSLTATDNCSAAITVEGVDVVTPGSCANSFTIVRTWTFVDACGNESSVSQNISVIDNIAPVAPEAPAAVTVACASEVPAMVSLTATDNCSAAITVEGVDVTTAGSCANSYTIVRTWTFVDECGNESSVSQNISVNDNIAPVAPQAPAAVTVACASEVPAMVSLTATDNCSAAITAEGVDVVTPGSCANSYTIVRSWTFVDECGNESSVSQNISVIDNIAPVIAQLPAVSTLECPAQPAFAQASATDNCGGEATLTFEDVTTAGTCEGSYAITRTWTAVDACGNQATASQTINVTDTTAPVISAEAQNLTVQCGEGNQNALADWLASNGGASATDLCSNITWTNDFDALSNDCSAAVTVTFTATDACGNSASTSATFTVQDTTAPVAPEAPAAVTVACASEVPAMVSLTATDNCSAAITVEGVDVVTPGSCANSFTIVRTWTFVDACGNESSVSQNISVNDNIAPVAPQAPAAVTVACASEVPAMVSLTATDNCSAAITVEGVDVVTPGSCANSYTIVRTWTFVDACGNESSVSQNISVNDNIAPVAPQAPAAVTVACASEVPAMVSLTATDNCSAAITAEGVDVVTPGSCANSYTIVRSWTFVDECGNESSVSQNISVNDNIAPVAPQAPADVTVACASEVPAMVSLTATDNCSAAITVEGVDVTTAGSCANSFTIVRTWTFVDECGNESSVSQNISVIDNIAPVIAELPAVSTLECPAQPAFAQASATDNCAGEVTLTFEDVTTAGTCEGSYAITRTWTAVDACGNQATASQTINVTDTTAPVISAEAQNLTVQCGEGNQNALADWLASNGGASATDLCSNVTWTNDFDALSNDCSAAVTVTFTATDACGNTASTSATFTVQDTTAPVAPEAPAAVTVACASEVPAMVSLTATDNCSAAITVEGVDVVTPGSCANSYTIVRTWTFVDACGNESSVSQNISVNDNIAPVAPQAPAAVTVACASEVPAMVSLTATDNCSAAITVEGVDVTTAGSCANSYAIVRTWTFVDACGNESSVSQNISVNDNIAPVAPQAPAAVTVACASEVPAMVSLTATDNCSAAITAEGVDVVTPGSCANSYTIVRTWTFVDACGNESSVSQNISVNDNIAPVAPQAPADVTVACASEVPAMVSLTATDNCSAAITVEGVDVVTPGSCANSFTIVRSWTFVDECGNESSVSQNISVIDNIAPVAPEAPADVTFTCSGEVPPMISLTATDNCGETITVEGVDSTVPGSCENTFTTTRTWTFVDECGNESSVSQVISVIDNVPPAPPIKVPADMTVECFINVPANFELSTTDNCGQVITAWGVDNTTAGDCANSGSLVRTWTFTDACGNATVVEQVFTVSDNTAPTFDTAIPEDVAVSCDQVPTAAQITATDNCGDATVTMTEERTDGLCEGDYILIRTWTATDDCGNATSEQQIITVTDTAGPSIDGQLEPQITANCDNIPEIPQLIFMDNCSTVGTATYSEEITNQTADGYTIVREWQVADSCGNNSVFTQEVDVNIVNSETNIPQTACNEDITVVDLNNYLPDGTPTGGTWVDVDTTGALSGSNFAQFGLAVGTYTYQYQIDDPVCPRVINIVMTVNTNCIVLPCTDILVHNAFSPNGDGINEHFQIDGINETECYPTNTVEIYNRWGVLVYETKQYDNADRAFKGYSEGRVTVNKNDQLPTGTYFYLLQYTTSEGTVVKKDGYLYLSR